MRWFIVRSLAGLGGAALIAASASAAEAVQASSPDGRWQVRAEGLTLAVFNQGVLVKTLAASRRDGRQRSNVAEIHAVPQRRSFVITFDSLTELWELSIDPEAEPLFDGLVHDYRLNEGLAEPGFLGVRRTPLAQPLVDLKIDDSGAFVLGREKGDSGALRLVQLDVRRSIARFAAPK